MQTQKIQENLVNQFENKINSTKESGEYNYRCSKLCLMSGLMLFII